MLQIIHDQTSYRLAVRVSVCACSTYYMFKVRTTDFWPFSGTSTFLLGGDVTLLFVSESVDNRLGDKYYTIGEVLWDKTTLQSVCYYW